MGLLTDQMPVQLEFSAHGHLMPGVRLQPYKGGLCAVFQGMVPEGANQRHIVNAFE